MRRRHESEISLDTESKPRESESKRIRNIWRVDRSLTRSVWAEKNLLQTKNVSDWFIQITQNSLRFSLWHIYTPDCSDCRKNKDTRPEWINAVTPWVKAARLSLDWLINRQSLGLQDNAATVLTNNNNYRYTYKKHNIINGTTPGNKTQNAFNPPECWDHHKAFRASV